MLLDKALGIVIPCYNEGDRLPERKLIQALQDYPQLYFCLVNDGSSDHTQAVIDKLLKQHNRILALQLPHNQGKAEAVRAGIQHFLQRPMDFAYLGYWDADLATPLFEVKNFMDIFYHRKHTLGVLGSRVLRLGGKIKRKWYRHVLGRVFATAVAASLRMEVYDSQCGSKLFQIELARKLFADPFCSRWFFDVELLYRCRMLPEYKKDPMILYEYPLTYWEDVAGSKLKLWDFVKVPLELWRIHRRYKSLS